MRKKNYCIENIDNCIRDSKKMCATLKLLLEDKQTNDIISIDFDGKVVCDSLEMTNRLNTYFIDSIELIIKKISAPSRNYVDYEIVYNEDVLEELLSVNKIDLDKIVEKLKNVGSEGLLNAKILKV